MKALKKLISLLVILTIISMMICLGTIQVSASSGFVQFIPANTWYFNEPLAVTVDSIGNVYVADGFRIQKFAPDGKQLTKWGSQGSDNGQIKYPRSMAADSSGNIYVADTANNRIQEFTSNGTFIRTWGTNGSADGSFYYPMGITVDSSGNVYVADTFNNRIQKFTSNGTFIKAWGSLGGGSGQFNHPEGIAVDGSGNVYVADTGNDKIQKFTPDGAFLYEWYDGDAHNIAVDASGVIYISEYDYNQVRKVTSTGSYLLHWGVRGMGSGQFNCPSGISVDKSGNIYVADKGNNRLQKFNPQGKVLSLWDRFGNDDGKFSCPNDIAVGSNGNIYVADHDNHRIQEFSPSGTFIRKWGSEGYDDGQFSNPSCITADKSGNIYVADSSTYIQKFTPDGVFLTKWGGYGSDNGMFFGVDGIAADSSGNIYAIDNYYNRVQKFSQNGVFISKWDIKGVDNVGPGYPTDIAADDNGNIYVSIYKNEIQKFTPDGMLIKKWGSTGSGDGQFNQPGSVVADHNGYIYVADTENNRIQKFTSDGTFVEKWGTFGIRSGELNQPRGLTVDESGNIYVADVGNSRIQKLTNTFYTISGNVGVAGATINYALGKDMKVTSDQNGNYTFTVPENWSGTITPVKEGCKFNPLSRSYSGVSSNQTAQNYTAIFPPKIQSVTADKASPQQAYSPITWTCNATGGTTLQYQFYVYNATTGKTTLGKAYSTSNTFTWTPTAAGNYNIIVWVKDSSSTNSYDASKSSATHTVAPGVAPVTVTSVTADKASPQQAYSPITWTCNAAGGTTLQYQYYVYNATTGKTSLGKAYSTSNTFTWTPTAAGNYNIIVWVKDSSSTKSYDASKSSATYTVAPGVAPVTVTSVTADKTSSQQAYTPITWTCNATGGTTLQYQFYIYNATTGKTTLGKAYSTSSTFTWTPTAAGNYNIIVWVKDSASANQYDTSKSSATFAINAGVAPVTITSVTTDKTSPQAASTPITINCNATGGTALQYQFYISSASGTKLLQAYSSSKTCTWTPTTAGNYTIVVWVKDTASTNTYDKVGGAAFTVN